MLEVRNIAFSYARTPILRDVSFVVSPGETVSLVGDNGAGKTTLLRVLATLAVPEAGQVIFDGQDAFSHPLRYSRQLGYMPEKTALYEDLTVHDYLRYRALLKGEMGKRIRRRIGEAAEACQLDSVLTRPIRLLSLGLRRRVALADALLLRPRVLLLDDPLAGLDGELRAAMGPIVSNVAAFSSVIVTGHDVYDMAKWTTRFLVLRGGVIEATIPAAGLAPEEILRRVRAHGSEKGGAV